MATHSSILTWRIPWTVAFQVPLSMGSQELDMTQQLNHHHSYNWRLEHHTFRNEQIQQAVENEYSNSMSVQFSHSVVSNSLQPMDCSTPSLPVHHQFLEFTQTHVHWVSDGIQPSHPLSSPSPPAFNLSRHQGLFKWVISSCPVAKVLKFQLQPQSFQWIFRTHFL